MNPLDGALSAALYTLDCKMFAPILYTKTSSTTAIFIFNDIPDGYLPNQVFFMPDNSLSETKSFTYYLSDDISKYSDVGTGKDYFLVRATTDLPADTRENFRVPVSFDAYVRKNKLDNPTIITVKDISAGGFFFISQDRFPIGAELFVEFFHMDEPLYSTAEILSLRPVRSKGMYGHACCFINLSPSEETAIRSFVFKQEVLQAKNKFV